MTEHSPGTSTVPDTVPGGTKRLGATIASVVAGAIVILWLCYGLWLRWMSTAPMSAADFGNAFGALGTLFSGLAFAGLIYTILLQREDLELQREDLRLQRQELELTRAELAKAAEAQKRSVRLLKKQVRLQEMGHEASSSPLFRMHGGVERVNAWIKFKMRNVGNAAVKELDVHIWPGFNSTTTEQSEISIEPHAVLKPGEDAVVHFKPKLVPQDQVSHIPFVLQCLDLNNKVHKLKFELLNGTMHQRYQ